MDETKVRQAVESLVCESFARKGMFFAPVASSNRHIHLSREHVDALFGRGYELTKLRDLKQPGQFACNEQVVLKTAKGSLRLRVVGPIRPETQIELTASDCVKLGLPILIRMSGDIKGTPGGLLETDKGTVALNEGIIVAARHLHLNVEQGKLYGLKSGDVVRLFVEGARALTLDKVIVRCGEAHELEAHIDIEEANACNLPKNAVCRIEKVKNQAYLKPESKPASKKQVHGNIVPDAEAPFFAMSGAVTHKASRGAMPEPAKKRLLSEADVLQAFKDGQSRIELDKNTLLTPLAWDRARQLGMEITEVR
ncbi:MAG: phosphate propanoyltransferase [Clostridia bacterium]|nr:phosphate propanoyltransferase [Clostridia bacterium]